MTELAHDPKNLKRFLNRYGEEAESLIKRNGYPPKYWKSRPHHREMQIKEVWENAKKDQKNFYFSKNNTEYIRTEMVRYHGTEIYRAVVNGIWDTCRIKNIQICTISLSEAIFQKRSF